METATHKTAYQPIDPAELPISGAWEARWYSNAGWGEWAPINATQARLLAARGQPDLVEVRGSDAISKDPRMLALAPVALAATMAAMAEFIVNGGEVSRGELVAMVMTGGWELPASAVPGPEPVAEPPQAQTAQDAASV